MGYNYNVTFTRNIQGIDIHGDSVRFCDERSAKEWVKAVSERNIGFSNFVIEEIKVK